jgi:WD40 repeat protein
MWICDLKQAQPPLEIEVGLKDAFAIAVHPDGRTVAVAGAPGKIRIVDLEKMDVVASTSAHDSWVKGLWFIDQGKSLISVGHDNHVITWDLLEDGDLARRQDVDVHADAIMAGAISPDESRLLTCSRDRTAQVWTLRAPLDMEVLDEIDAHIVSMAFSPDGGTLAAVTGPRNLCVWDMRPLRLRAATPRYRRRVPPAAR